MRIKGIKDRYTLLSEVAMDTLKKYREKQKPENGFFAGKEKKSTSLQELPSKSLKMQARKPE